MNNLEKQLNCLPKGKLRRKADLKIRWRIYILMAQKRFDNLYIYRHRWAAGTVLALFVLIFVIPGYVYASPSVNRLNFLYPVKQAMENVEVTLKKDPVAKFNTLEKFTQKRLAEINTMAKSGAKADKQAIINTMDEALKLNLQAGMEMEKIKKSDDRAAAKKTLQERRKITRNYYRPQQLMSA